MAPVRLFAHTAKPSWVWVLTAGLGVALCWCAAYWTWVFLAPSAPPLWISSNPASADSDAERIADGHLFGTAQRAEMKPLSVAVGVELEGVMAGGDGQPGYAIIRRVGGAPEPVAVGAALAPGVILRAVYAHHVLVDDGGTMARVALPGPAAAPMAVQGRYARHLQRAD
ncbi:MAG: hypothetical protein M0037_16230 [Betaproteobacteria bacterium]|nr:hypothetical protein [Betaproteobacteria bacterium]